LIFLRRMWIFTYFVIYGGKLKARRNAGKRCGRCGS
jgi:hypothetical protein